MPAHTQHTLQAQPPIVKNAQPPVKNVPISEESLSASEIGGSSIPELERANKRLYIFGYVLLALLILGTVGIVIVRNNLSEEASDTEVDSSVQVEVDEEIEAEEIVEIEEERVGKLAREEISIIVLNGSGISGEAGRIADLLEDLKYEIAESGNAEKIATHEFEVKREYKDQVKVLLDDLEELLGITKITGTLSESEEAIARLTIGSSD